MNFKKTLLLALTFILLVALAACGGNNDEKDNNDKSNNGEAKDLDVSKSDDDFPIVEEEIEMTVFANKPAQNEDNDWNDILIWNTYEEKTNIKVNWDLQSPDSLEERRNIALQGGDLPDAFFLARISLNDTLKYGSEGVFLTLNDYIDEYAPNLTALMEEDEGLRKAITHPDGNIYSMPSINESDFLSSRLSARPWINTEHVEELGMEMPETTEAYYEFLKGVKELAPAGDSTIPYGGTNITELVQWLTGSFGVMNKGPGNHNFDLGEDGDIRFYANTDEYKQLLQYINKLYSEGLMDEQIFDGDWSHFTGLAAKGSEAFSSYVFYDPEDFFGEEVGGGWESLNALEGPEGHQEYNKVSPAVYDVSAFVITSANENPEAAVRWMDYFYSDDGTILYNMGVEGESFEIVDGEYEYMDHIANPEGDTTFEQAMVKQLTWLGSTIGIKKAEFFAGGESKEKSMKSAEAIKPYTPDEIWPRFTFTVEESEVLSASGSDIAKYVEEMRDKFIAGQADIDTEWDDYVESLNEMGLEEVIEINQEGLNRYKNN